MVFPIDPSQTKSKFSTRYTKQSTLFLSASSKRGLRFSSPKNTVFWNLHPQNGPQFSPACHPTFCPARLLSGSASCRYHDPDGSFWHREYTQDIAIDDKRNEHCLIRPYLGRRLAGERNSMLRSRAISLRNYQLHLDQIEELGLPATEYAMAVADAFAFLLWAVRIDARDVGYVLARPRADSLPSKTPRLGHYDFTLGSHALWILDFDCCKELSMDIVEVHRAAERFWRNDAYSRTSSAKRIWSSGRSSGINSLRQSWSILRDKSESLQWLPELLIDRITDTVGVYTGGIAEGK